MKCSGCGADFEPTPSQVKKHDWFCKGCSRTKLRAYRERRKAEGRPIVCSKTWDPAKREAWKKRYYTAEKKAEHAAFMREYTRRPEVAKKCKTRWATKRACAKGEITKTPCRCCGVLDVQRHHPDYDRPEVVVWLCRPCHVFFHKVKAKKARGEK